MNIGIIFLYTKWHYFDQFKVIAQGCKNILVFNINYFSIPFLLKTLFSHWRKYRWSYGRGFEIGRYFQVLLSNLISRIIGAFIRLLFIFVGLILESFLLLLALLVLVLWISLPFTLIYLFFFSFGLIF
jgi:hypothetical protein